MSAYPVGNQSVLAESVVSEVFHARNLIWVAEMVVVLFVMVVEPFVMAVEFFAAVVGLFEAAVGLFATAVGRSWKDVEERRVVWG